MKLLIASDIHGSAKYCSMLMDSYVREGADRLILLGDILYHGPRNDLPDEYRTTRVIEMLNERRDVIYAVRGNCDSEVDQMVLKFPLLADYAPIILEDRMIYATHGHLYNKDRLPPIGKGKAKKDILLTGHTHIPACEDCGDFIYMNPGSVSLPKANSPRGYIVTDGGHFVWKTLEGDEYMSYE
ncbi:MAG: phosphodiesterase [Clostridia bacterium]|nr:phosphodiesterase [Clostridia bacterium]